jgi:hypothetical protein
MSDKIVQTTAQIVSASTPTYTTKITQVVTPVIAAGANTQTLLATAVVNIKVVANVINMGEESIPNPSLFQRLDDFYTAPDRVTLRFNKRPQELINSIDIPRKRAGKTLRETPVAGDTNRSSRVNKSRSSLADASDTQRISTSKIKFSSTTNTEQFNKTSGKLLPETETVTDQKRLNIGKVLPETANTSVLFSRTVVFNRLVLDIVDATDDFLGLANIDDDQIASVGKKLIDYTANFEQLVKSYNKQIREISPAIDQVRFNFDKQLRDTETTTDVVRLQVAKTIVETETATDQARLQVTKPLRENTNTGSFFSRTVGFSRTLPETTTATQQKFISVTKILTETDNAVDQARLLVTKNISDTETVVDQARLQFTKPLSETDNATDQIRLQFNKPVNETVINNTLFSRTVAFNRLVLDSVDATDDFFGLANIDDDQIAFVGKTLVDYAAGLEQFAKNYIKQLSETDTATDVARLQTTKAFRNTETATDVARLQVTKTIVETDNATDQARLQVTKPLRETSSTSERFSLRAQNVKTEIISSLDLISFFKFANRFFDETFVTNDSGFINNQNYTASAYTTAGYVGTNTNFS